jgi:hypothetical protein
VAPGEPAPRPYVATRAAPRVELDCEGMSGKPPEPKPAPLPRQGPAAVVPRMPITLGRWGVQAPGLPELPPFLARPGPAMGPDQSGAWLDIQSSIERSLHTWSLGRAYAWGPRNGDWDQLGRWDVHWLWPFGGWPEVRSTATTPAPWPSIDAARRAFQQNTGSPNGWWLAVGDDADHALLVVHRTVTPATADVLALEADRAPVEVHRPGGDLFPEVDGAARIGGRWYLATAQPSAELPATVVWLVDGDQARELARVPRAAVEGHPLLRMARRMDGRALGLVVDGQPDGERRDLMRWVVSVDLESGAVGEPEPLAPVDLSDRAVTTCKSEDSGWQVDLPYWGPVMLHAGPKWQAQLQAPLARMRLSRERACLERLVGTVEAHMASVPEAPIRSPHGPPALPRDSRAIDVAVFAAQMRYAIRCSAR